MSGQDDDAREGFSLKRWSTRKLQASRDAAAIPPAPAATPPEAPSTTALASAEQSTVGTTESELPPIDSLTIESDYSVFMGPKVAESLKRQALKKLFADPHFNTMDGLDVYIDDYSVPSPIEPDLVAQLAHARFTLNPPVTRVNAEGVVEDVPPEELAAPVAQQRTEQIAASDPQPASRAAGDGADAQVADDAVRLTDSSAPRSP